MATSPFFNTQKPGNTTGERFLYEDLIAEVIRIYGTDCYYIPRESEDTPDLVYGEDPLSKFTRSFGMEMYIKSTTKFQGDRDFFTKFGLELRDDNTFVVSARTFSHYVPQQFHRGPNKAGPKDGDWIWVPLLQAMFEIKDVQNEVGYYQFGKQNPFLFELNCEKVKYSNERVDTALEDANDAMNNVAYRLDLALNANGTGIYVSGEIVYQGSNIASANASAEVFAFNVPDSVLSVIHTVGEFSENVAIIGATSNAHFTLLTEDLLDDERESPMSENVELQIRADDVIDTSEPNVFGRP